MSCAHGRLFLEKKKGLHRVQTVCFRKVAATAFPRDKLQRFRGGGGGEEKKEKRKRKGAGEGEAK